MKRLKKAMGIAAVLWASVLFTEAEAAAEAPGDATAEAPGDADTAIATTGHHVHLTAVVANADARWYITHMGGTLKSNPPLAPIDRAYFGEFTLIFYQKKAGYEGSEGSVVDHIGFSFSDLDAKMKEMEKEGITILQPVKVLGDLKFAIIEGPSGVKIELLEDPDLLGFHHVHIHSTAPEETIEWFAEILGGETTHFKGVPFLPAVRYENMWVIAEKTDTAKAPTKGRALDHLGFGLSDLDGYEEEIKAKGVEFTLAPRNYEGNRIAFLVSPEGINIELVKPVRRTVARPRTRIKIDVRSNIKVPKMNVHVAPKAPKINIKIAPRKPK